MSEETARETVRFLPPPVTGPTPDPPTPIRAEHSAHVEGIPFVELGLWEDLI